MHTSALSVSENVVVHLAQLYSSLELHIKHSRLFSPDTQPDEIKVYDVRPQLGDHRVFLPKSLSLLADDGDSRRLLRLPLVISIHGSAWIVGNPSDDDALNRHLADHAGCVVVALNHSKAPQHPFPAARDDVVALIRAVLADPSLPVDPDRVVVSGGSSGGNLALSAMLDPALAAAAKEGGWRPRGMIALCPPVDMVRTREEKMASRSARRAHVPDILEPFYETIRVTYLQDQKDSVSMADVRLSPAYFESRDAYPRDMYFVGFEDDLLCQEAEDMADRLASMSTTTTTTTTTKEQSRETTELGWRAGGVVWEMIPKQSHGFAPPSGETAEAKAVREAEIQALYGRLAEWIRNLVAEKQ